MHVCVSCFEGNAKTEPKQQKEMTSQRNKLCLVPYEKYFDYFCNNSFNLRKKCFNNVF